MRDVTGKVAGLRVLCLILGISTMVSCDRRALNPGADGLVHPPVGDGPNVSPPADGLVKDSGKPGDWQDYPCVQPKAIEQCSGGWCTIPAGCFWMGSPPSEPCRSQYYETLHQVTLTHDFEISQHEVTQGEFQALVNFNPSYYKSCGSTCPVEMVFWREAALYCNALSAEAGLGECYTCKDMGGWKDCAEASSYSGAKIYDCPGYRLPTDAEWEYAYRAGTTTAYYNGVNDSDKCKACSSADANADKIGWYCANSEKTTHPVGQKQPNAWGLYDMAGNVSEWCHDRAADDLGSSPATDPWGDAAESWRVQRGGAWFWSAIFMRAAERSGGDPAVRQSYAGFRCARTK